MFLRVFLRHSRLAGILIAAGPLFAQSPVPPTSAPDVNSTGRAHHAVSPAVRAHAVRPPPPSRPAKSTSRQCTRSMWSAVRLGNWSDSEQQALGVGVKMAREPATMTSPRATGTTISTTLRVSAPSARTGSRPTSSPRITSPPSTIPTALRPSPSVSAR